MTGQAAAWSGFTKAPRPAPRAQQHSAPAHRRSCASPPVGPRRGRRHCRSGRDGCLVRSLSKSGRGKAKQPSLILPLHASEERRRQLGGTSGCAPVDRLGLISARSPFGRRRAAERRAARTATTRSRSRPGGAPRPRGRPAAGSLTYPRVRRAAQADAWGRPAARGAGDGRSWRTQESSPVPGREHQLVLLRLNVGRRRAPRRDWRGTAPPCASSSADASRPVGGSGPGAGSRQGEVSFVPGDERLNDARMRARRPSAISGTCCRSALDAAHRLPRSKARDQGAGGSGSDAPRLRNHGRERC